jgi:hypothetical protein
MPFSQSYAISNHLSVFLETGTFHGGGITKALNQGFKKIISIEIFEPLYIENLERFKKEISEDRVKLVLGDSGHVIGKAVEEIEDPITFWFDAHDQRMSDAGVGDVKCPIIKELTNIMQFRSLSRRRLDTLMIDDMRLITNKNVWQVNTGEMYQEIWNYNPDFSLTRVEGHIDHDILKCEYRYLK